jgi:hypothetical protein
MTMDYTACLVGTVPAALTGAAMLQADGTSSYCYTVNVQYTTIRHELRHVRKAWPGTVVVVDPYLL